jgi:hypothetical protein
MAENLRVMKTPRSALLRRILYILIALLAIAHICTIHRSSIELKELSLAYDHFATRYLPAAPHSSRKESRGAVLIIAAVPRSERHVVALWSELECFSLSFERIVIAAPLWSKDIIDSVISKAVSSIPSLPKVETKFFSQRSIRRGFVVRRLARVGAK